jgi:dihydroxy-acid dehydratase
MGIALPGNTDIPAADSRRLQLAETAGRRIVAIVDEGLTPSKILTEESFDNAIRTLHAIGGSTNAIIHLIAIANRLGIEISLERFDSLARTTPFILNLKPSGQFLMEDFFYAGGLSTVLKEILPLLNENIPTVTGKTLGENLSNITVNNRELVKTMANPLATEGGLAILKGSLAPDGAVIRSTSASPALLTHRGKALVFENHYDMDNRIDDPNLDVAPNDVLILRNSGPVGAPGMPEWGFLPLPKKLLQKGVRDMVRLSDARMSGTAFGTVVVHITPESAVGGPLAAVRNGDIIELDVPNRKLDILVDHLTIQGRLIENKSQPPHYERGYKWMFSQHVLQANEGCDFDFLRAKFATE